MIAFYCKGLSMDPLIREGDLILVEPVVKENILLGDIVAFRRGEEADRIAHRVVGIPAGERRPFYLVRADFTDRGGVDSVAFEDIVGKVVGLERNNEIIDLQGSYAKLLKSIWNHFPATGRYILALLKWQSLYLKLNFLCNPRFFIRKPGESLESVRSKFNQKEEVQFHTKYVGAGMEDWEQIVAGRYIIPGSRVLDIGCGAGREAMALAERGFEVVGIDISPEMIRAAREENRDRGLPIRFEVMAASEIEFPGSYFDCCLFTRNVHAFIPTKKLRVATLRKVKECLKPGGLVFLNEEIRERDWLSGQALINALRRARNALLPGLFFSEPGDVWKRGVSPKSRSDTFCFYHCFYSNQEILDELHESGFIDVTTDDEGFFSGRKRNAPPGRPCPP